MNNFVTLKKSRVLILCAAMLASFTACGNNEVNKGANAGASNSSESSTPNFDKKIKISWVGWSSPVNDKGEIVKEIEEKFNVDINMVDASDGAAFDVKIAAGEVPDVFPLDFSKYQKFIDDEIVGEIPYETIEKYAPNLYQAYQTEVPTYIDLTKIGDKNYGLVVPNPESGNFRPLVVWRGDWLKNVGITKVPESLSEFEDAMYKFTNNDPDKNGKKDTYGLSESMMQTVYGAYGYLPTSWTRRDGKLVYGAVQPEMKEALKVLAKWYKDGVLTPEFINGENKGGDWSIATDFVNGIIGVTSYADYLYWKPAQSAGDREGSNITEMRKTIPDAVDKLVYGKPIAGPDGKKGLNMRNSLQGRFIVFGKQVEKDLDKQARILSILDYSSSTYEGYMLTRYGKEGVHYNMKDGYPEAIAPYSDWNEIVKIGGGATFNNAIWLPSIIQKVNREYAWGKSLGTLQSDGIMNEVILPLPSASKYQAEIDKIRSEAYVDMITGKKTIDYFDTFVANWRAAGGSVLEEEAAAK